MAPLQTSLSTLWLGVLLLAPGLATALVPACLVGLGPEFCPGTGVDARFEKNGTRANSSFIAPAELTLETVLKDELFPRMEDDKGFMVESLRALTDPIMLRNRYCKSQPGADAQDFLSKRVERMLRGRTDPDDDVSRMLGSFRYVPADNETLQESIIFRVLPPRAPYAAGDTIVLGAHMDSINRAFFNQSSSLRHQLPRPNASFNIMVAPGADDNGSGTVVLISVLKALTRLFAVRPVVNEVQFHWYAAEEVGLKGSEAVFASLRDDGFAVKAMLNLDMVGYAGAHAAGTPKIALQRGFDNKNLTDFVAKLVDTYTDAEPGFASCRYACSDHASAYHHGVPSAMIGESSFLRGQGNAPNGNPYMHTEHDTVDKIDFDYMFEFAKVAAAFAAELAYTNFTELESGAGPMS